MRYAVGEIVRVTNYDPMYNGHTGVVTRVNGEYHYVAMLMQHPDGTNATLELYASEMMTDVEYWENMYPTIDYRKTPIVDYTVDHFEKDLFEV